MGNQDKLMDQIFNLRFMSKTLARQAKKCEKDQKDAKLKVKKAIEKGNMDGARIYAQDAIRKKTEELNYLRLASRLDAVVSRLDTQMKMQVVHKSMEGITKALEKAVSTSNLEQISQTMDTFERQFESLDVQSEFVESAMGASTSMVAPEDEHGLEVAFALPAAAQGALAQAAPAQAAAVDPDADLSRRLAELRQRS
eukprot:jgi/Mesvir1/27667/Mv07390-RA.1